MEEKMGKANEQAKDKPSLLNRWLNGIEKVGNKLPHPISIFAILVLFVIVLSAVCEMAGVSATGELVNRSKGVVETQTVQAVSLLNGEGLVYMLTHAITNFTGFAPLGVVLVAMFGIGLLEDSGLIGGALKSAVEVTPAKLITPMMSYFAMIIVFMKKYDKEAGIGTLVSTMLPYSICFLIGWSILLVLWIVLNLPLGPGVGMFLG